MMKLFACFLSAALLPAAVFADSNATPSKFREHKLPITERVDDPLSSLTIDEKISQTFPAGVLFADAERTQPGLRGEVFSHETQDTSKPVVEGKPASTRSDAQIDFQWAEAQPIAGIPIKSASTRWTGVLIAPASGDYVFGIVAEGAVRLFINDIPVINSWRRDHERPLSTIVPLEKDRTFPSVRRPARLCLKRLSPLQTPRQYIHV